MAKVRRELKSGIEELKEMWETKVERHVEEIEQKTRLTPMGVVSCIVVQIVALGFANFIIWTAKPTSSEEAMHRYIHICLSLLKIVSIVMYLVRPTFDINTRTCWYALTLVTFQISYFSISREELSVIICYISVFFLSLGIFSWHPTLMVLAVS